MDIEPFFINAKWYLAHSVHEIGPKRTRIARGYWHVAESRWLPLFSVATSFPDQKAAAEYLARNRVYLEAGLDR